MTASLRCRARRVALERRPDVRTEVDRIARVPH